MRRDIEEGGDEEVRSCPLGKISLIFHTEMEASNRLVCRNFLYTRAPERNSQAIPLYLYW